VSETVALCDSRRSGGGIGTSVHRYYRQYYKLRTGKLAIPLFLDHPKFISSSKLKFVLQNRFLTLGWSRIEIRFGF
jgi:hypothetical protein